MQAKYGAPTGNWTGSAPYWEEKSKPSCIRTRDKDRVDFGESPQVSTGQKNLDQAVALLEAQQQRSGNPNALPADLRSCGTFMYYTAGSDPVQSITGGIYDVGAIVATHHSRRAWVEQLKSEAIRKREGKG